MQSQSAETRSAVENPLGPAPSATPSSSPQAANNNLIIYVAVGGGGGALVIVALAVTFAVCYIKVQRRQRANEVTAMVERNNNKRSQLHSKPGQSVLTESPIPPVMYYTNVVPMVRVAILEMQSLKSACK